MVVTGSEIAWKGVPMSSELFFAYLLATIVIVIVPGPTVTLIVANSLTHGTRAGLLNVAGTQAGLAVCIGIVALGLASFMQTIGWWFDWLRILGAAYLIWLGWKLIRSTGEIEMRGAARKPRGGFLLQGFLVMLSNPKTLFFFGAFIPQFIDPTRDYLMQIAILGPTAMLVALASDGARC
jgi:homoserine/homoserine lactone efflux protein